MLHHASYEIHPPADQTGPRLFAAGSWRWGYKIWRGDGPYKLDPERKVQPFALRLVGRRTRQKLEIPVAVKNMVKKRNNIPYPQVGARKCLPGPASERKVTRLNPLHLLPQFYEEIAQTVSLTHCS